MDIESLGITKADLINRIVEAAVEHVLDGHDAGDRVVRRVQEKITDQVNAAVEEIGDKQVLPLMVAKIDTLAMQVTTGWGEKIGKPVTFREYMQQRAEKYMTEEVNYEGMDAAECRSRSNSFNKSQTRIAHMVNKHLHYEIEIAMKDALKAANSQIAAGIQETVKIKLAEIAASIKTTVTVGRG